MSEIMLQQTQVHTVKPYYVTWMAKFASQYLNSSYGVLMCVPVGLQSMASPMRVLRYCIVLLLTQLMLTARKGSEYRMGWIGLLLSCTQAFGMRICLCS